MRAVIDNVIPIVCLPGKHILRIRCVIGIDRHCDPSTLNEIPWKQQSTVEDN